MYERWGGRPTTQLLRTRDESSNPRQRDIWRQAIEEVTDVQLLSKRREAANPVAADHAIEAATDQVRYLGQDPRFPMVANENAAYGFERNMWGFRRRVAHSGQQRPTTTIRSQVNAAPMSIR
ncbi:hypothetical protein ABZS86_19870 [Streptomyces sp. NPDC005355]|uniref:hypothetical protein n=1 Tax=Streptomyces sp. NPDC005355 TaxID=3157038 RepID=UPI00339EA3FF